MKFLTSLFLFAFVISIVTKAALLTAEDAKLMEARAKKCGEAFETGDVSTIIEMTHPSIYKLMGGKAKMMEITHQAMAQLKAMGVTIVSAEFGTPTESYVAGDEIVCFYPRTTVMQIQGKKAKATGFLICVRKVKGGEWLFLDSSALQDNPKLLTQLLPALPADVPLPTNKVELMP